MCIAIYEWVRGLGSGTIGNLISAFAAIVAISALIIQSRSTRKQVKLQNFIEYTKRYQEIILHFPETINKADFELAELKKDEYKNTMRFMRAYFDLCFEEYTLHNKKYIDKDFWSIWEEGMKYAFSKSAFKQAWSLIKKDTKFGNDFENFVERSKV